MEQMQLTALNQQPETLTSNSSVTGVFHSEKVDEEPEDSVMGERDEYLVDSTLCVSGSRLLPSGLTRSNSTGFFFLYPVIYFFVLDLFLFCV